jgi:hypothetical protein
MKKLAIAFVKFFLAPQILQISIKKIANVIVVLNLTEVAPQKNQILMKNLAHAIVFTK